jgi:two-component sensor histidine kinase
MQRPPRIFVDIPALRPGTAGAFALAVLSAAAATALRVAIDPYVTGDQFITFFPAIILTTLFSGPGAGLLCLVLCVCALVFFLLPPIFSFHVASPSDVFSTVLFVLLTLCIIMLMAGVRFALERYQELDRRLEQHEIALQEREERLAMVVAELQHRTRNLISVVSSIADDTIRTSSTLDEFKVNYHDRLDVLGRAQGLLFRTSNGGRVTFDELLDSELTARGVRVGDNGQVTIDGPKGIRLRSGSVQTLALVLHELLSNALRYGALRQPEGRLAIRWRYEISDQTGKPWLHLDWQESCVAMPTEIGTGRGRQLIERALPYQFGARTTFTLEPDGLHCTISLPTSEHGQSADKPSAERT